MQDHPEDQAEPTAPEEVDLSTWYSQAEACAKLKLSKRWLNEQIADGSLAIEKRMRPKKGQRAEPSFNPVDVDRIVEERKPKPPAFSVSAGVEPRANGAMAPVYTIDTTALLERVFGLFERRLPPLDRGPLVSIKEAAAEFHLHPSTLRQVVLRRLELQDPDCYCDRAGMLWIRRGVVASIDTNELHAADNAIRARRAGQLGLGRKARALVVIGALAAGAGL